MQIFEAELEVFQGIDNSKTKSWEEKSREARDDGGFRKVERKDGVSEALRSSVPSITQQLTAFAPLSSLFPPSAHRMHSRLHQ